jgi:hypothetical protein
MGGKRVSLTGNERLYISYWLDRAVLEATEFSEVSAIASLKQRLSERRVPRSCAITVRPAGRPGRVSRSERLQAC